MVNERRDFINMFRGTEIGELFDLMSDLKIDFNNVTVSKNIENEHLEKALEYQDKWRKTGLGFYRVWQAHELMQVGRKRKLMIDDDMLDAKVNIIQIAAIPPDDYLGTMSDWEIKLREWGKLKGDQMYYDVMITKDEWWELLDYCEKEALNVNTNTF